MLRYFELKSEGIGVLVIKCALSDQSVSNRLDLNPSNMSLDKMITYIINSCWLLGAVFNFSFSEWSIFLVQLVKKTFTSKTWTVNVFVFEVIVIFILNKGKQRFDIKKRCIVIDHGDIRICFYTNEIMKDRIWTIR